ncbi:hypothetical protein B0H14DRAFT_3899166 [Mycena olivaceomarginata]|nr:hypothetical protein B0H14DRAFT_3899166 [Mycena olivaceomarginata]
MSTSFTLTTTYPPAVVLHSTAPRGPLANIINLMQEIAPATPRTMRRIRTNIQAGMNELMPPAVRGNVAATIVRRASTTPRPPIWPLSKNAHGLQVIKRITVGVIVNCTILAIWLHSPDTQLQATGDTTHINYSARLSRPFDTSPPLVPTPFAVVVPPRRTGATSGSTQRGAAKELWR